MTIIELRQKLINQIDRLSFEKLLVLEKLIQDSHHQEVKNIYFQQQKIIVPQSVLAEVAYLLGYNESSVTQCCNISTLPTKPQCCNHIRWQGKKS
jgi:hypothetical protein